MDRKEVKKRVQQYGEQDLIAWRKHVLVCLAQFEADQNEFEIEECHFLLQLIDQRLERRAESDD